MRREYFRLTMVFLGLVSLAIIMMASISGTLPPLSTIQIVGIGALVLTSIIFYVRGSGDIAWGTFPTARQEFPPHLEQRPHKR